MLSYRTTCIPGALAAGLGLGLVVLAARAGHEGWGLPLDDAWIHAAFARHLAHGGRWSLFAGGSRGGETSLLWPVLLAPGEWIGRFAPALALVLGSASWLVLPGLTGSFASTPARGRVLAVAVGLCGPLLFAAVSGMETLPTLTAGLAAIVLYHRGSLRGAMLLAGAAAWLRPDAVLLLGILAAFDIARRRTGGASRRAAVTDSLRVTLPGAVVAVAGLVGLALADGRFPPSTLGGRRWIGGLDPGLDFHGLGHAAVTFGLQWLRAIDRELGMSRLAAPLAPPWPVLLRWVWRLAAAGALGGVLVAMVRRGRRALGPAGILAAWTGTVVLAYALVLPDRGHVGRYQPQVYLLFAWAVVEGIAGWLAVRGSRRVAGVAALVVGVGWLAGTARFATGWAGSVAHLERVHVRAARELSLRAGPDAIVGVFDVGAVAYEHDGPLVDMSGLSDPAAAEALHTRSMVRLLAARGATHVLLPIFAEDTAGSLRDRLGLMPSDGIDLRRVITYESPAARWGPAFQTTGNAFRRLFLYEIRAITPPTRADR